MSYGEAFFAHLDATAEGSAKRVLPMVIDLLGPRSIVDVGCGLGTWLAEAERLGIEDYLGIDGYAPSDDLRIPRDRFVRHDLSTPLQLDRRFDLVISLEVAEHLPPAAADPFVDGLTALGPAVLFSAAVPNQSGEEHLNEQWPGYWTERFAARGMVAVDAFRPALWLDEDVSWWYRQNTLLFCTEEVAGRIEGVAAARRETRADQLAVVHPVFLMWMAHQRDELAAELARPRGVREVVGLLPGATRRAFRRRLRPGGQT